MSAKTRLTIGANSKPITAINWAISLGIFSHVMNKNKVERMYPRLTMTATLEKKANGKRGDIC